MKFSRHHLAAFVAAIALISAGCAGQSDQTTENVTPAQAPPAGERLAYQGDMNGTDMMLVLDPATNGFLLIETPPGGTASGPTAKRTTGTWTSTRGTTSDPNATVYELTAAGGGGATRFLLVNDSEIRQLGPDNLALAGGATLRRTGAPDATLLARHLTIQDAGSTIQLRPGEEIVVMLPVAGPGEQWVLTDSTGVPLQRAQLVAGEVTTIPGSTGMPPGSTPNYGTTPGTSGTMADSAHAAMPPTAMAAYAFKATSQGNGQLKLMRQGATSETPATPKEFMVTIVVE